MNKRNTKRLPKTNSAPLVTRLLFAGLAGSLLGIALLFASAVLFSFAALKSAVPGALVLPASLAAVFACGYGGALLGAKRASASDCSPYQGGLAVFVLLSLFILLLSLFFANADGQTALQRLLPLLVLLLSAALGSVTAVMHRPKHSRKLKKLLKR